MTILTKSLSCETLSKIDNCPFGSTPNHTIWALQSWDSSYSTSLVAFANKTVGFAPRETCCANHALAWRRWVLFLTPSGVWTRKPLSIRRLHFAIFKNRYTTSSRQQCFWDNLWKEVFWMRTAKQFDHIFETGKTNLGGREKGKQHQNLNARYLKPADWHCTGSPHKKWGGGNPRPSKPPNHTESRQHSSLLLKAGFFCELEERRPRLTQRG